MLPSEIAALRNELALSPGRFAERLGVPVRLVLQWEAGELFPTKKHCLALAQLRSCQDGLSSAGANGVAFRAGPNRQGDPTGHEALAASVTRRLLADPGFAVKLQALVDDYLSSSSSQSAASPSSQPSSEAAGIPSADEP